MALPSNFLLHYLTFQGICHSGCWSSGLSWVFLLWDAVSSPLWMSSTLVLLPSLRKKNREPHSWQEKVGAKRVKIALEELFLPTPHHPSFSSFFTFSFAPFYIWVKESLHYLMPSFFWEKKFLPFFGKTKFLHWFCHPQSHGKNLTSPTNYLILSTVEKMSRIFHSSPRLSPVFSDTGLCKGDFCFSLRENTCNLDFFFPACSPYSWIMTQMFLVYSPEMLLLPVGLISADISSMPGEFRAGSFLGLKESFLWKLKADFQLFAHWTIGDKAEQH